MSNSPRERHPLDDDNDDAIFDADAPSESQPTNKPLQLFAVYALIATAVLVVISGAVAANAPTSSPTGDIAWTFNRLFMVLLLVEFGLLLLSYRYQQLTEVFSSVGSTLPLPHPPYQDPFAITPAWKYDDRITTTSEVVPPDFPTAGAFPTPPMLPAPLHQTARPPARSASELAVLFVASLAIAAFVWILLFLAPTPVLPWLVMGLSIIVVMSFGLMITVAVFRQGVLRGYAIGVAANIALTSQFLMSSWWSVGMMGGSNWFRFGLPTAITVSLILASGLICATFVRAFGQQSWRERESFKP